MADEPINLNRVRKARARNAAKRKADANAALHGLTKAEKARARAEAAREAARHEAGRRGRAEGSAEGVREGRDDGEE